MNIQGRCAVVTGAGSGIGQAVAVELAERGVKAVALVNHSENVLKVARMINDRMEAPLAEAMIGDVTDADFRRKTFDLMCRRSMGRRPSAFPPRASIVTSLESRSTSRPARRRSIPSRISGWCWKSTWWRRCTGCFEMVARIAENRRAHGKGKWDPSEGIQGTAIFIGSISSSGIPGQVSYSSSKAALEGAAATLSKEAIFHGVRFATIHPGFTDTPMVRAMGEEYIEKHILPYTQLKRLIDPAEIADAIYFMICNSAVSGELWADAGWHPQA